jgi:prolyl-tRNA synthetase
MQDRKALQAGTSHFLGQNFSRAQEIKFQDPSGTEQFAWTTSWGVSTRLVGALVMTHSDDNGLVLPPRLAPKHVVIMPIYRNDEERSKVLPVCESLRQRLHAQSFSGHTVQAFLDDRDLRGGEKNWYHVKRGVPIRVEIGPRDIAAGTIVFTRRDQQQKTQCPIDQFVAQVAHDLDQMQSGLFQRAEDLRREHSREINTLEEFREFFTPKNPAKPEIHGGFAWCFAAECPQMDSLLQELKVTVRCLPHDHPQSGPCLFSGTPGAPRTLFAKAY